MRFYKKIRIISLATSVMLLLNAMSAMAQEEYVKPTDGILLSSPLLTEVNDATAISTNPANMGFLDAWSLVYAGTWINDDLNLYGQGHGLFFAVPLGPIGLGVGTEFLMPSNQMEEIQGLDSRVRFSLGLSINPVRALGFGITYRTFWAYELGDIDSLELSVSVRPSNYMAASFVFSDVNQPTVSYAAITGPNQTFIPQREVKAPRKLHAGLTLRPFANDRFAFGGEIDYVWGDHKQWDALSNRFSKGTFKQTGVNGYASMVITDGVSLRTRVGTEDIHNNRNLVFVDTTLVLDSNRFPFGLGISPTFQSSSEDGDGLAGMSWSLAASGDARPSIPMILPPAYGAVINVDKPLGSTHSEARLYERLERLAEDKSVNLVLFRPDPGTINLTQSLEIRRRFKAIKAAGKTTVCYLKEATRSVYLSCAGADHVWINPGGGVRISGMTRRSIHLKAAMDKIGVKADIVRIGKYKSYPETFTRKTPSTEAAFAINRYLDSAYGYMVANTANDRELGTYQAAKKVIENGPYIANEALAAGLVDKVIPMDLLEEELKTLIGGNIILDDKYDTKPRRHRSYLDSPAVAVVHIEGDITDGESVDIPFLKIKMTGAKTVVKDLRKLAKNPEVQVVLLRINTPGGSALASEIIWREVMAIRKDKQVVASMGSLAASGGYYIASAANRIFAEPTTLTGSIGIFYGKADVSGLLNKLGVSATTFNRGEHADIDSWTRPYTPQERERLQKQIQQYYNLFLDRVAEGRGAEFTRKKVDERGQGRIWSGADAQYHELVDELGGYIEALDYARNLASVSKDTRILHVPAQKKGLIFQMARMAKSKINGKNAHPIEYIFSAMNMKSLLAATLPFAAADPGAPRARLPFALIEE